MQQTWGGWRSVASALPGNVLPTQRVLSQEQEQLEILSRSQSQSQSQSQDESITAACGEPRCGCLILAVTFRTSTCHPCHPILADLNGQSAILRKHNTNQSKGPGAGSPLNGNWNQCRESLRPWVYNFCCGSCLLSYGCSVCHLARLLPLAILGSLRQGHAALGCCFFLLGK